MRRAGGLAKNDPPILSRGSQKILRRNFLEDVFERCRGGFVINRPGEPVLLSRGTNCVLETVSAPFKNI